MTSPNKSLGQHWLFDAKSLEAVCDAAHLQPSDTVLEIGPGLGTLTARLAQRVKKVIAVEIDPALAQKLPARVTADNVEVIHGDIMHTDLSKLPRGYKVVANVPYYITSSIVRFLTESPTPPQSTTILIQKEVAERIAARPGNMSILAVTCQFYATAELGPVVTADKFEPAPKVDSQIITLSQRPAPLFADVTAKDFFKVVKAGFGEKRKTLRNSLSGGLRLTKEMVESVLDEAHISHQARAEQLALEDWYRIVEVIKKQPPHKNMRG